MFSTRLPLASPDRGIQAAARQFIEHKVADQYTVTADLGLLSACPRTQAPWNERMREAVATALVSAVMVDFKASASAGAREQAIRGIQSLQAHCDATGTRIKVRHVKLLEAAVDQAQDQIANFPRAVRAALGKEPSVPALVRRAPPTPPQRCAARPLPTLSRSQAPAGAVKAPAKAKPVRLVTVPARDPRQHERLLQRRRELAEAAQAAQPATRTPQ
jgi:hypothetical protein